MFETERAQAREIFLEKVKTIPFLNTFEEEDLQGILQYSALRHYEAGEFIIDENYYDNSIYFLISGSVRITRKGKEIRVLRRRGEIFGEMSIVDGSFLSSSAYAIVETTCLVTNMTHVKSFSEKDSLVFYSVLYKTFAETLAERLRTAMQELANARAEIEELKQELG
ncbi:MAG TPA: cyclic nucleotide-binding domain-containing protein [Deltaproteobacteria bacterium]|nr:cyclic nucleotide-binding domain-containing protein [Deltaproteobacteria bacterium]